MKFCLNRFTHLIFAAVVVVGLTGCVKSKTYLKPNRTAHAFSEQSFLDRTTTLEFDVLSLDDIVSIALSRNLSLMVKEWECAIQREVATGAKRDTLPEVLSTSEISRRNNSPGSSSESLEPGVPPAPPSISSEQHTARWDVTLTWNLLDFGLSYFRSRQEANRILLQNLEYEKIKQNLILEIVEHFWNAAAAQEAIVKIDALAHEIEEQTIQLETAASYSLVSKVRINQLKDRLLELRIQKLEQQGISAIAMTELAKLMGVLPATPFQIHYDPMRPLTAELPDPRTLEITALNHRPELYFQDVQEHIDIDEVWVQILEYVPGLSFFASYKFDDNRFLLNNHWSNAGAMAAWDLLSLPTGISNKRAAEKRVVLTRKNRLTLAAAAVSQVNLATISYHNHEEIFNATLAAQMNKAELLGFAQRKVDVGMFDQTDIVEFKSKVLEADIRTWRAYADLQLSLEKINNAIGIPLYFRNNSSRPLLTQKLNPSQKVENEALYQDS